ncbi:MAG: DUF2291 domain-containing protein [Candidatus Anaerobiospirillum merdipullorum]|uniref:DUF2291 domain-containing protein n=1 Tax=Candidatus Anaerobiospirillum merdipullorum TaxID=2838450 RepID=A0A9E2KNR8_9GAMM|nr:DUF2291 domain-containing protein [Candidatus Anaerobiospirillum merdipullorum]
MRLRILALALCSGILCFSGCRMVSVQEYQQLQDPESPLLKQAPEIFKNKLTSQITETALAVDELTNKLSTEQDFAKACETYGFRQSSDLQCNFPVKVEGSITAINTKSRRGTITVTTAAGTEVKVQIGPVIMGTALRDIQKGVSYTSFNDQTVYGEYGELINAQSVELSKSQKFEVGQTVEIYGAFSSWDFPNMSTVRVAPVAVTIK